MQATFNIVFTMATDENVYTTLAFDAQLAVKVGTVWEAGAEQQLNDSSNVLKLHVTTFQDHGHGQQYEF